MGPTQSQTLPGCTIYYTAQSGDSCWSIEQKFCLAESLLYQWNPEIIQGNDCVIWLNYSYCVAGGPGAPGNLFIILKDVGYYPLLIRFIYLYIKKKSSIQHHYNSSVNEHYTHLNQHPSPLSYGPGIDRQLSRMASRCLGRRLRLNGICSGNHLGAVPCMEPRS